MRRHTITAAILMVLAPLTAAPDAARAAGMRSGAVQADQGLPSITDEVQGMQPVYTPGNLAGQYGPGPYGPRPGAYGPGAGGYGPTGDYGDGGCGCGDCGCSSCEQPCCEPCCCDCCCGPTLEARIAGVVLRRSDPDDAPFLSDAGTALFDFSQFNFDYEPGVDGSVIGYLNPCVGVEARYLGLFDAQDNAFVTVPAATATAVLNTNPVTGVTLAAGATIDADYRSELQSGEINLRGKPKPWLTLLGGFRYINLRERFNASLTGATLTVGGTAVNSFETRVQNDLYGVQLGAETNLFSGKGGRYNVGGFIKGGIFAVQASNDATLVLAGAPVVGSDSETRSAFVAEAGANASFQVTRYLSVSAGYQILWLQDVALASDQVGVTGTPTAGALVPTHVDLDGQVFYHGIKLGADLRY